MNNFSVKGSEIQTSNPNSTGVNYVKPGIHELIITDLELKSAPSGSKYIDASIVNRNDEKISRQYYLNTEVKNQKSALQISMESIKKLCIVLNREEDFNNMTVNSEEELLNKLKPMIVGRWFRNKVKGEEVIKKDGGVFVKSKLSDAYESIDVPKDSSKLKFDEYKDIQRLNNAGTKGQSVATEVNTGDLPF